MTISCQEINCKDNIPAELLRLMLDDAEPGFVESLVQQTSKLKQRYTAGGFRFGDNFRIDRAYDIIIEMAAEEKTIVEALLNAWFSIDNLAGITKELLTALEAKDIQLTLEKLLIGLDKLSLLRLKITLELVEVEIPASLKELIDRFQNQAEEVQKAEEKKWQKKIEKEKQQWEKQYIKEQKKREKQADKLEKQLQRNAQKINIELGQKQAIEQRIKKVQEDLYKTQKQLEAEKKAHQETEKKAQQIREQLRRSERKGDVLEEELKQQKQKYSDLQKEENQQKAQFENKIVGLKENINNLEQELASRPETPPQIVPQELGWLLPKENIKELVNRLNVEDPIRSRLLSILKQPEEALTLSETDSSLLSNWQKLIKHELNTLESILTLSLSEPTDLDSYKQNLLDLRYHLEARLIMGEVLLEVLQNIMDLPEGFLTADEEVDEEQPEE